jgi:uncharacterized NAD(P)/FAD-binding protein YdhS
MVDVAIIGLGSRGLSVLERVVTLAKRRGADPVTVHVIDPTCAGAGVHDPGQPDYLLLNTTCAQVSMFPDAATVGSDVDEAGPNLYEWVTARGLRMAADGFTVGPTGRAIRPTDFLPRRVLGDYLAWCVAEVARRAAGRVPIHWHRAEAVGLADAGHGRLVVRLAGGPEVSADHVFLTTGYTSNEDADPAPYPLPERVAGVRPGELVAIEGFGLTAMDLMSCFTVGRGGRFVPDGAELRYEPSGQEPVLLLYSRTGVPCRARPQVKELGPAYEPLVFTPASLDARRARVGPLDYEADVLPLVLTEVRIGYRRCEARLRGTADELEEQLASAVRVEDVLDELDRRHGRFDPAAALDGSLGMGLRDPQAYQDWLAGTLRRDLDEGRLGFAGSPLKAGLDVVRALRDTFRYAIDFGGLTEASLDEFHRHAVPAINRAVVGPQFERHAELLALLAAGVAGTPFGPSPTAIRTPRGWSITSTRLANPVTVEVDHLVRGHVPLPGVAASASPLLASLRDAGWIRPHRPASGWVTGIDVDRDQHPITVDGRPRDRIVVLGPLCEGATFYNNLVPSPNAYSRPVADAHRCVAAILGETGQASGSWKQHPAVAPVARLTTSWSPAGAPLTSIPP